MITKIDGDNLANKSLKIQKYNKISSNPIDTDQVAPIDVGFSDNTRMPKKKL